MSISVVRTALGWAVESGGSLRTIATGAITTGELLADRDAITRAADGPADGDLESAALLSPITVPCRLVAQMVNYRSHAADSGFDPNRVPPAFFRKASGSVAGPQADVIRPAHVRLLDYEVELAVVIGAHLRVGTVVTDADLPTYAAGIVIANDISARDVQLTRTQFYESKSYPTFTPIGPRLVLLDDTEWRRLAELRLTLDVNGERRQDCLASDMIVKPLQALQLLSRFQELAPGDVLLTGTPGGTALKAPPKVVEKLAGLLPAHVRLKAFFAQQVKSPAYLKADDVITTRIGTDDGAIDLGMQRNTVRAR
jgi:2-keto-4-pentenoate hydratase/2-oxohepta-3-ene-1,7-dioic acid hydratase in catechol pathway